MEPTTAIVEVLTHRCLAEATVCAACHSAADLAPANADDTVLFCRDCREQLAEFDLDDPFVDLGGGD